jgi:hypothetical protein
MGKDEEELLMPDFTICTNNTCSQRLQCYRYKAIPNANQSYCYFNEDNKPICRDFIEIYKWDKINEKF